MVEQNVKEMADRFLSELKNELLINTEEKYHDDLINGYYNDLSNWISNSKLFYERPDDFFELNFERKKNSLRYATTVPTLKLNLYILDESYNELVNISGIGFKAATDRINKSEHPIISKDFADGQIDKMTNLHKNVREFNVERANQSVSEGILDYKYASGESEFTSIRVGGTNITEQYKVV